MVGLKLNNMTIREIISSHHHLFSGIPESEYDALEAKLQDYVNERMEESRQEGYNRGYDEGYSEGHSAGNDMGYMHGYNSAKSENY